MNRTIDDLANRWLKRRPDDLGQIESRVLQSTLERTTISRDTNKAVAFHRTFGDYEVNLKAEIEIMALHEKLDELRHSQIIGMRDKIERLADVVKRIDERLGRQSAS